MANPETIFVGINRERMRRFQLALTMAMTLTAALPVAVVILAPSASWYLLLIPIFFSVPLYFVLSRFLAPLAEIAAVAEKMLDGDLKARALIPGKSPWRTISRALHSLAEDLTQSTSDLESIVSERTKALRRTANQLRAVGTIGQQIASVLEPHRLIHFVVRLIRGAFHYDVAAVLTIHGNNSVLSACAARDLEEAPLGKTFPLEGPSAPAFTQALQDGMITGRPSPIIDDMEVQSELAVEIKIADRPLGILLVQSKNENAFDSGDEFVVKTIAGQVAVALENARLLETERKQKDAAVIDERNRMAREIHDTLAQGLIAIMLRLREIREMNGVTKNPRLLSRIDDTEALVRENLREARRSVWDLRPEKLESADLTHAITDELNRLRSTPFVDGKDSNPSTVQTTLYTEGSLEIVDSKTEVTLFRIAQEAIRNAFEHGKPNHVSVRIKVDTDEIMMSIEDDGLGFTWKENPRRPARPGQSGPMHPAETRRGIGMHSMGERARSIGGAMTVETAPGKGCKITVWVPLKEVPAP